MTAEIRKVALLISCLPHRLATRLIDRLPDEYQPQIRRCLTEMADVDAGQWRQVVREYLSSAEPNSGRRYRIDAGDSLVPSFHFLLPLSPKITLSLT